MCFLCSSIEHQEYFFLNPIQIWSVSDQVTNFFNNNIHFGDKILCRLQQIVQGTQTMIRTSGLERKKGINEQYQCTIGNTIQITIQPQIHSFN